MERADRALNSGDAGRINNEDSKQVCSDILRKTVLHLPCEACWL